MDYYQQTRTRFLWRSDGTAVQMLVGKKWVDMELPASVLEHGFDFLCTHEKDCTPIEAGA